MKTFRIQRSWKKVVYTGTSVATLLSDSSDMWQNTNKMLQPRHNQGCGRGWRQTCWNCKRTGHLGPQCPERKNKTDTEHNNNWRQTGDIRKQPCPQGNNARSKPPDRTSFQTIARPDGDRANGGRPAGSTVAVSKSHRQTGYKVRYLQLSPRLTNYRIVMYSWWLSHY
jgi:hypothetical protein